MGMSDTAIPTYLYWVEVRYNDDKARSRLLESYPANGPHGPAMELREDAGEGGTIRVYGRDPTDPRREDLWVFGPAWGGVGADWKASDIQWIAAFDLVQLSSGRTIPDTRNGRSPGAAAPTPKRADESIVATIYGGQMVRVDPTVDRSWLKPIFELRCGATLFLEGDHGDPRTWTPYCVRLNRASEPQARAEVAAMFPGLPVRCSP